MADVCLGLGSNLGDRAAHLRAALARLRTIVVPGAISSVWRTEPVGYSDQPEFWNLVLCGTTELSPEDLLAAIQDIEAAGGRTRSFPNAPRTIDIDLLLYDDRQITRPELTVPHPRMLERGFVLRPLAEVAPWWVHPITGERIADHLARATGLEAAERLFPGEDLLRTGDSGRSGEGSPDL